MDRRETREARIARRLTQTGRPIPVDLAMSLAAQGIDADTITQINPPVGETY